MDDENGAIEPYFVKTAEIPHKTLSLIPSHDPSPRSSRGEAKKALLLGLAASGASSLLFIPLLASAGFFGDFLQKTASSLNASGVSYNSQTVPLLSAATNLNPNPPRGGDLEIADGDALVSQDNPDTAGDTATQITNPQISVYVVREGDTLSGIATLFGVDTSTIIGANDISNGVIRPGQELIVLPIVGIRHTVLKGETLASLASKYHSDAHGIAMYNNLSDDASLTVGDLVIIPNAETPTAVAPAPTKSPSTTPKTTKTPAKVKTTKGFVPAPLRDAGGPEYDGYYGWPLSGGIITQSLHGYNAVDIGAPIGTSIFASAAGTVIIAKDNGGWNGGYGNYVVIQHDNGTQTLYAHMSRVLTSAGDSVSEGELIGKVGRTGEATGPHLHFELRGATNPFGAIPVGEGD